MSDGYHFLNLYVVGRKMKSRLRGNNIWEWLKYDCVCVAEG